MHPTQSENGFTQDVFLNELDPTAANVVRNVLNAGATIGAVKRGQGVAHFVIRSELHEFLSDVIKREQKRDKVSTDQSMAVVSLEREIHKVLLPEVGLWAETVLHYMHPINNADGFSSEIVLEQVRPEHVLPVRNVLNVGAHRDKVRRDIGAAGRYEVHGDIHSVLTSLRAREYLTSSRNALQVSAARSVEGGVLGAGMIQGASPQQRQIGHRETSADHRQAGRFTSHLSPIANPEASAVPNVRPTTVTVTGTGNFDDDLAEHFAREMNLQTQMVTYLRDQSALIDVAGLQRSLDAVMLQDDVLRRILKQAQAGIEASIDEARHSFAGLPSGPVDGPLALNSLADVLGQMVPVILLSPGLAYDNVINKMEAELSDDEAEGRLDVFKVKKLKMVIDHRGELARAKYSEDHWRSVQKSLQRFATGLATLAGADQKQARMR